MFNNVFQVQKYLKGSNSIQNIYGKLVIFCGIFYSISPLINYFLTGDPDVEMIFAIDMLVCATTTSQIMVLCLFGQ